MADQPVGTNPEPRFNMLVSNVNVFFRHSRANQNRTWKMFWMTLAMALSFSMTTAMGLINDVSQPTQIASGSKINKGYLFSAISFSDTPLGERWATLRPEAEKLFPNLKLKQVCDLHITIIYIGKEWKIENLEALREAMAVCIADTSFLSPVIANFGKNKQVVVVEMNGVSEPLKNQIVGVKDKLNKAGLKSPESYDHSFRAHVTLAESKDSPPTKEQAQELKAFQEWIIPRLELSTLKLVLDPGMPVRLMLAGATRTSSVPEYITVESFLENNR